MFTRPTTYVLVDASKRLGVPVTFAGFSAQNLAINISRRFVCSPITNIFHSVGIYIQLVQQDFHFGKE